MNDNFSAFTLYITVLSAVTLSSATMQGKKAEKIHFIAQKREKEKSWFHFLCQWAFTSTAVSFQTEEVFIGPLSFK